MRSVSRVVGVSFAVLLVSGALSAQGRVPEPNAIPNWSVPAMWSPSQARGGYQTMVDISDAIAYVAINPCRIADTRVGEGFTLQAGPPGLTSFTNRNFQISGIPAGTPVAGCPDNAIPSGAEAVSVQFTVVFPTAAGNLVAWQAGGAQPLVSVINWDAGTVALGSGTIVPLSTGGAITVRLNTAAAGQGAELVIDVNGYFSDSLTPGTLFDLNGNDASAMMTVSNASTASGADGIRATQNATGLAYAVYGLHNAATGEGYGVGGETDSITPDSAGVVGIGPGNAILSTADLSSAGVRGEDGGSEFGVIGAADSHTVNVTSAAGGFYLMNNNLATIAASALLGRRQCIFVGFQICNTYAGYFTGNVNVAGTFTTSGPKEFVEPMASDPTKMIRYVSLEGPEAGTYLRGKARFVRGLARITPPDHFREVSDPNSLSVQITPIGEMATYAVVKAGLDEIVVKSSRNVEFYYTVNSVRRAYPNWEVVGDSVFIPESVNSTMSDFAPDIQRRLIENGLFKADGSVNMETAERLGLLRGWAEAAAFREAENKKNNP